jgi:Ala-tRNA(Pro) deacylase
MTIAPTLQKYLADHEVAYDLVPHPPTESSLRTAEASHVPGDRLVKAVVVRDKESYWLAVLPASRHIQLGELRADLGQHVDLATEQEIEQVFRDCDRGAIPPVGACYGLDAIVDDSIDQQPEVYFEGGDHTTLVHMTRAEFVRLNATARQGSFTGSSPHA